MGEPDGHNLHHQLAAWYRERKRDLPFRHTRDPYAILVAETVLQRTRVKAGLPYYGRFLEAFPTIRALAASSEAGVLRVWEGLGFYGRARNLLRAAKVAVERHGGELPADVESLRALPGIGEYTAGAVGSIAFGLPVPAVDGNASRVLSRIYRVEEDVSRGSGKRRIRALAAALVPLDAPGEWNQALMELGATVCVPKSPKCALCPVSGECMAFAGGVQDSVPRTAAKSSVPIVPVAFVVARKGNSVLLVRRHSGLHAGLYGLPGGQVEPGETAEAGLRRHLRALGIRAPAFESLGRVHHAFSHLRWEGTAYRCRGYGTPEGAEWVPVDRIGVLPLVPLHRRLVAQATR